MALQIYFFDIKFPSRDYQCTYGNIYICFFLPQNLIIMSKINTVVIYVT